MYLEYILNVFLVYLSTYSIYLKVFQCIYSMFQCISMCLNVFINIVIGISPSHFHCNVFAMHTHLHIFFHFIHWLPSLHAIQLHFFFPFSLIRSSFHTIYEKVTYQSLHFTFIHHPTFHILHSMSSLVTQSIVESKLHIW
jgi:hypothetical protein